MPTPLGHAIVGLAAYAAFTKKSGKIPSKKEAGIALLCSYAPDLDFIPGLIMGNHFAYHHGPTHSLLFGIIFGFILSVLLGRHRPHPFWKGAGIYVFLVWIHILLDMCIVNNRPIAEQGLNLFYPFSSHLIKSPVDIFFVDAGSFGSIYPQHVFTVDNLFEFGLEIVVAAAVGFILYRLITMIQRKTGFYG